MKSHLFQNRISKMALASLLGVTLGFFKASAALNLPVDLSELRGKPMVEGFVTKVERVGSRREITIKKQGTEETIVLKQDARIAGASFPAEGAYILTFYDPQHNYASSLGSSWLVKTGTLWSNLGSAPFITPEGTRPTLGEAQLRDLITGTSSAATPPGSPPSEPGLARAPAATADIDELPGIPTDAATPLAAAPAPDEMILVQQQTDDLSEPREPASTQESSSAPSLGLTIIMSLAGGLVLYLIIRKAVHMIALVIATGAVAPAIAATDGQSYLEFSGSVAAEAVRRAENIELQIIGATPKLPAKLAGVDRVIPLPALNKTIMLLPPQTRVFIRKEAHGTKVWWQ